MFVHVHVVTLTLTSSAIGGEGDDVEIDESQQYCGVLIWPSWDSVPDLEGKKAIGLEYKMIYDS